MNECRSNRYEFAYLLYYAREFYRNAVHAMFQFRLSVRMTSASCRLPDVPCYGLWTGRNLTPTEAYGPWYQWSSNIFSPQVMSQTTGFHSFVKQMIRTLSMYAARCYWWCLVRDQIRDMLGGYICKFKFGTINFIFRTSNEKNNTAYDALAHRGGCRPQGCCLWQNLCCAGIRPTQEWSVLPSLFLFISNYLN